MEHDVFSDAFIKTWYNVSNSCDMVLGTNGPPKKAARPTSFITAATTIHKSSKPGSRTTRKRIWSRKITASKLRICFYKSSDDCDAKRSSVLTWNGMVTP